MKTGVVKSFNRHRGWGFIVPDEDDDGDVFIHVRQLSGIDLVVGQRVGFNVKNTVKGRRAVNIIAFVGSSEAPATEPVSSSAQELDLDPESSQPK